MGFGSGPQSFNSMLQCAFSPPFLSRPSCPTFFRLWLFCSVLILGGGGQKPLLKQRRSRGITLKALQICHVRFPKRAACSSGSLLALPSRCTSICWICWKGARPLAHAGPHLLQVQLANLVSALLTTRERLPTAKSRAACRGSAFVLPACQLPSSTVDKWCPTPWGNAPSLILWGGYLPPLCDQVQSL